MTSGAIQATVPANDIRILLSVHSRLVPKSEIFTMSFLAIRTLQHNRNTRCDNSATTLQHNFEKSKRCKQLAEEIAINLSFDSERSTNYKSRFQFKTERSNSTKIVHNKIDDPVF